MGIRSLEEARAYLAHPILGVRLAACSSIVVDASDRSSLRDILGSPDDLKICSSMTLLAIVTNGETSVYRRALDRWCDGHQDWRTLERLHALDEMGR
ncbi:MAG: hypothetical protein NVSMB59_23910 [Vulcanimicrobiaceae bacterium]